MRSWCRGPLLFACDRLFGACRGQATVEAAFLVPSLLLGLMLLIQPGIILYDRMVMSAAASEGCRLLVTKAAGEDAARYQAAVKRALASVPQQDNFHVHDPCSWDVSLEGGEGGAAFVTIRNKLRPLPLFDWGARALGALDSDGLLSVEVSCEAHGLPDWVSGSSGGHSPRGWIGSWDAS